MKFALIVLIIGFAPNAHPEESYETIQTQALLKDKSARDESLQNNPQGKEVDAKVNRFTGDTHTTQEIYELAADIFPAFVKEANGDPEKIQELLKKAAQNPESVSTKLTDEQKNKLSEIANKMPRAPAQN